MHSKNKGKAHQINKKEEFAAACVWECGCGSGDGPDNLLSAHTHTYTRLLFSEQLLSPLHAGTSLGNHHGEASPKNRHRGPPSLSLSVSPPPLRLSIPLLTMMLGAWEGLGVHGQTAYWADSLTVCSIQSSIQAGQEEGDIDTVTLQWVFI